MQPDGAANLDRQGKGKKIGIEARGAGQRLDVFLCRELGLSRREAHRAIDNGGVTIEGRSAGTLAKGILLEDGWQVCVSNLEIGSSASVIPQPQLPLKILQSGEDFVVVDKPAGMAVHPLGPHQCDTVLNAVAALYPQVQGVGEGRLRSGVVHRLDVDTSGALAVALTGKRWRALRRAFKAHQVTKTYRALVHGKFKGQGHEEMDLVMASHQPARVKVVTSSQRRNIKSVRRCDLTWRAIESFGCATLVEVELGTGFLHQIRVMLAHQGHGVIGDRVYGNSGGQCNVKAPRQMLHAAILRFDDIDVTSLDPADFQAVLDGLRGQ